MQLWTLVVWYVNYSWH